MEGTRLGPYQLLSELGSGGMGRVYRAEVRGEVPGLAHGRPVALKVIHGHLLETPGYFKRFLREADIGRTIEHENVVRTYDCDALLHEGAQQNFLVMEYVEGQTLRDLLKELERVPEELCRHIGCEVAKGLAAIHGAGVVHRDLKPENVLITPDHVVKVMDLGVARLTDETIRLSRAGAFVGSLEYAAPEQFRGGEEEPDGRADLHALGVLLYELATGRHPYRDADASNVMRNILDETPRKAGELNPQLSPFFEEVVGTLMAKSRDERFAAASDLAAVLEEGEGNAWWRDRARALRDETRRPLRRIRIPRETALYGRDDDLAKLRALYEKARAGEGQVLLVEGEAGIGKTRLVDEFVGRLRQDGEDVNFLFGSYPPGGAATAAGAFSTAYREHFGDAGLEETLREYVKPTPILIPAFAALLRGETTPTGVEPLTKDSLQTVFVHATRRLAEERPTVLVIEDLHLAPEEGRALFTSVALAAPEHRLLLIGTMRPGVSEQWKSGITRLDHAEPHGLTRLGPKDLGRLLRDAFRSDRLADELGWRIAEKSDGNPFFVFEIIRGLREGEFITQRPDGSWVTTKVIQEIEVPSSVLDLVNARLAVLSDADRDLLDLAACYGYRFDPTMIATTAGLPRIDALKRFGRIERRYGLVRSAGRDYLFDHHQVQEALQGALNEQLRQEYHTAIAESLEARSGTADLDPEALDGSLCVDICDHHLRGTRPERSTHYVGGALRHLAQGFLNEHALALANRALDPPDLLRGTDRVNVLLHKCSRLRRLGRTADLEAALDEARTLAEEIGDARQLAEVEQATAHLKRRTGRYDEARAHAERALELFRSIDDRWRAATVTSDLGTIHKHLGDNAAAQACLEKALAVAREMGRTDGAAAFTVNLGLVAWAQSRHAEARAMLEEGLRLAIEGGSKAWEAKARHNLGNVLAAHGLPAEARASAERALALHREVGDRTAEAGSLANLGIAHKQANRLAEALDDLQRALNLFREIGARRGEAVAHVNLGPLYRSLGDPVQARRHLEAALETSRAIGAKYQEGYALAGLAGVATDEGRLDEARRLLEQSLAHRRAIGHLDGVGGSLGGLGELHLQQGQVEDARACFEEARRLAGESGSNPMISLTSALLAALPGGGEAGEPPPIDEREPNRGDPRLRFLWWRATGDLRQLREAKRLLDDRVAHAPEAYRSSMVENVPLHRDIVAAWTEHGHADGRADGHAPDA